MRTDHSSEPYFVFGSNELGIHGAGAAKAAKDRYGARVGQGFGPQGRSFGIPTCARPVGDPNWQIGIDRLKFYVDAFLLYAQMYPEKEFKVTQIGCGLAGWKAFQVAPLFAKATKNCSFDTAWVEYLPGKRFWGTA